MGTAIPMAAGLGVLGVSGYVFLALAGRTLQPDHAAAVQALYFLANILGPGVFTGVEQETNRASASALSRGAALAPVLRQAVQRSASVAAILLAALAAGSVLLTGRTLHGEVSLLLEAMLAVVFAAAVYVVRGLLGGRRRFGGYAVTLAVEGLARLLPCVALSVLEVHQAWLFGLVFACGQGFAAAVGIRWLRAARGETGHNGPQPGTAGGLATSAGARPTGSGGLAMLVTATFLAQAVANLAPLIVGTRLAGDAATAFGFGQAFVLVRIPLLLFAPVQAMVLPGLSAAATAGNLSFVRRRMRLLVLAVLAVGAVGTLCCVLFGGWILRTFFAVGSPPSPVTLG
ncbi:MAG: hypothetical protein ACRDRL_25290, partial [Sciscionella sp.]